MCPTTPAVDSEPRPVSAVEVTRKCDRDGTEEGKDSRMEGKISRPVNIGSECNISSKTFALDTHMKAAQKNGGESQLTVMRCPFCPKRYATKDAMVKHISLHETLSKTGAIKYRCSVCRIDFPSPLSLGSHNAKNHQSRNCPQSKTSSKQLPTATQTTTSSSSALLLRSQTVMVNNGPGFQCSLCSMCFSINISGR